MKKLEIEWRHLEIDGKACVRCSETGKTLSDVVADVTNVERMLNGARSFKAS